MRSKPTDFAKGQWNDVESPLAAAVDIGTTTLAVYLLDGVTGTVLSVKSMMNPQKECGLDVTDRCRYALKNGAEILEKYVRESVNLLLREAALECGRSREDVVRIVMAGNSCMHHLFLGIPTDTLAVKPCQPKVLESLCLRAADYGIYAHPYAQLWWLPNLGGFVGADTTACILDCGLWEQKETALLIDVGTSVELVLGNRDGFSVCSVATGPVFEGGRISCGMRNCEGAIDQVSLEDGKLKTHVIGDGRAIGIGGSGFVDAAACLLKTGEIDQNGRIEKPCFLAPKVAVRQQDIRELQLAKAAVAAGIQAMCIHRKMEIGEIQQVFLAGSFGNNLNPESVCRIGMIPLELENRIRMLGNAAGDGAQLVARNEREFERCAAFAQKADFLELAHSPGFQEVYIKEMRFPEGSCFSLW